MPRTLYSPRFSDDVVRALYREGQRRKMSMTRLADLLLRQSLGRLDKNFADQRVIAQTARTELQGEAQRIAVSIADKLAQG